MILKKLSALILALAIIFSFASCGEKKTAETEESSNSEISGESQVAEVDDVSKAYSAHQKLGTSMQQGGEYEADIKMIQESSQGKSETTGLMKIKTVDGKEQVYMEMDADITGQKAKMIMVTDGTTAYYEVNGQKIEIDMTQFMDQVDQSTVTPDFQKEAIKSCEIIPEGSDTRYKIVLNGELMTDLLDQLKKEIEAVAGGSAFEIAISDVTYDILLDKKDEPKSMVLDMTYKITAGENSDEIKSKFELIFKSFSDVKIDLSKLSA